MRKLLIHLMREPIKDEIVYTEIGFIDLDQAIPDAGEHYQPLLEQIALHADVGDKIWMVDQRTGRSFTSLNTYPETDREKYLHEFVVEMIRLARAIKEGLV